MTKKRSKLFILIGTYDYKSKVGLSSLSSGIDSITKKISQEIAGISITLIKLDDEIKKHYDMAAASLGYLKFKKEV